MSRIGGGGAALSIRIRPGDRESRDRIEFPVVHLHIYRAQLYQLITTDAALRRQSEADKLNGILRAIQIMQEFSSRNLLYVCVTFIT